MYERQNSKYFLTAERNEDMPFLIFEPGINVIPLGAALLSLSSSAEYSNNLIRLCPPSFIYSSSKSSFKHSSILQQRLIQSDIGLLEILPCNQLRNA